MATKSAPTLSFPSAGPAAPPLVSVCIPVYNGACFIGQAIQSVLGQSFADFELVVVDNASTDGTPEVVQGHGDPRLRLLRNAANLGAEANWNRCLEEARGQLIKLLPADDLLYPECLARQVAVFAQTPPGGRPLALAYGGRDIVDEEGRQIMALRYRGAGRIAGGELIRRNLLSGASLVGPPGAVLFSAAAARAAGRFDARHPFVIDLDYWCRLLLHGDGYAIPETLCAFRLSRGSWTVTLGRQRSRDYVAWVDGLRRQPEFAVTPMVAAIARQRARLNGWLRTLVIRLALRTPQTPFWTGSR